MSTDTTLKESPKVQFHTLGCRLNFYETDGIYSQLSKKGFRLADPQENPDYVIVNTCTVTNRADSKNRSVIRQAIKKFPHAKVVVTGCYAQTDREALESIPGVFKVVGNDGKSSLPHSIWEDWQSYRGNSNETPTQENGLKEPTISPMVWNDRFSYADVLPEGHTRAYLKIQDGCNRKCSYCKIPSARGMGVSRKESDVLTQIKYLQDNGVAEIQLTGVNLGWFRDESGDKGFIPLLEKILDTLDYSRIRLSSIEPPDVGSDLADLLMHPRFCKFLHIPIQSGSREILRKMQRTYHPDSFRKRIEVVKSKIPEIFLGTDAIVGFPGEGEREFEETKFLLKELGFARVHAFPYSVRKGTKAESMGDPIPGDEKKRRVYQLMEISRQGLQFYVGSQIGKIEEAIVETDGKLVTGNYLKGALPPELTRAPLLSGQFVDVQIQGLPNKEGLVPFSLLSSNP